MAENTLEILRRLHRWTSRSLATYIVEARPWVPYRREGLWQVLEEIASRHREWATRLAAELARRGEWAIPGSYPIQYARYHDLTIDYVARAVAEELRETLQASRDLRQAIDHDTELLQLFEQLEHEYQTELENLTKELQAGDNGKPLRVAVGEESGITPPAGVQP